MPATELKTKFEDLPPGQVSYSPMERQLFKYLRGGKRLTSTALIVRFYRDKLNQNFHARETVNAALSSLKRKLEFNKAPFRLQNSALSGPHPKEWWLE